MRRLMLFTVVALTAVPLLAGQARRRGAEAEPKSGAASQAKGGDALEQASGYQTPNPDGSLSCSCNVLLRITTGLQAVVRASAAGALPAVEAKQAGSSAQLASQVSNAEAHLKDARGKGWQQQEDVCGKGAGLVGDAWATWQPFLARNGMDSDFYTGVKARNPDIPNEGDEKANDNGRSCNPGQWWTEDRAYFAINGREGVCTQDRYRINQLLNGSQGDRGYRCFDYKLK